jgi:uncharacterized protein YfaS (alpha-2-macroglobulin family)
MRFALPSRPTPLLLSHSSQPGPWATVAVRAAVPLITPDFAGYRISRKVTFVERKRPGQLSRGDVLRISITVEARVDRNWVVIEDPIPAGSSIIGDSHGADSAYGGSGAPAGGGQSSLLASEANRDANIAVAGYVERGFDAWRGYFGWWPQGTATTEYVVRINTPGRFQMPPTRVEAMYSPEIHGALPNRPLVVAP